MLKMFAKILRALNGDSRPAELALAAVFAWWMGMTPGFTLSHLVLLALVLVLRCNLSLFLVLWPVIKILYLLVAPGLEWLGLWLLSQPALHGFWEAWYNTWPGRWMAINDPRQTAALAMNLMLSVPLFFLANWLIVRYRNVVLRHVQKWRVSQWFKATRLWRIYETLGGGS
jgi:uncharacterized protein (TIGR03546 family)